MDATRRIETASNRRGQVEWRIWRRNIVFALISCGFCLSIGCGGRSGEGPMGPPISIHLPVSTVTIVPGGAAVSIVIQINSPSETALVSVGGLPAGVSFKYSSSDTNPSGILTFTATSTTIAGTYTPTITVISANQTVSTRFILIAKSA
ncbi:MAG: hypothetical protein JST28_06820 [Acidobacteria bacterium]|nr:hypothetical protein [Acidobacteriota bacterium]